MKDVCLDSAKAHSQNVCLVYNAMIANVVGVWVRT